MAETGNQFDGAEHLAQWASTLAINNAQILGKGSYLDAPYQTEVDGTIWSIAPMTLPRAYQVPRTVNERVTALTDAGVRFDMWLWAETAEQQLMLGLVRVTPTEAVWVKVGAWAIPDSSFFVHKETFTAASSRHRRKRQTR